MFVYYRWNTRILPIDNNEKEPQDTETKFKKKYTYTFRKH